jgi:transcriptional regulator with XRE-family HTH domain
MALFFDSAWFDSRLAAVHLSRADLARALGLNESQIAEVWKDQRELSARDVSIIAALLAAPAEDVAKYAGISTPSPRSSAPPDFARDIAELKTRLDRVEQGFAELKSLLAKHTKSDAQ